jgi:arabinofuranosyltransferase
MAEAEPVNAVPRSIGNRTIYICSAALLVTFIVRTAWICDDAYITARTIDHWLQGYGLRWNISERVQTFTHPLWLLVIAAAWRVAGGFYWSSMVISIAFASCAAIVMTTMGGASLVGAAALFVLSSSQAFVDFATSGLETPLTYCLLAVFLVRYSSGRGSTWVLQTTGIAALAAVNRLDTLVILAPALLHVAVVAWRRARWQFILGLTPLLAWEAFSLVYYGFLVPNTAYAKLATGIPQSALTEQGLAYLQNSWRADPPTLIVIGSAAIAALWTRRVEALTIAAGLVLQLVYIVRVGGDFMSGRFLAPAVLVAVGLLLHQARTLRERTAVATLLIAAGAFGFPDAAARAWPSRPPPLADTVIDEHGVADERLVYVRETGLLDAIRRGSAPEHPWALAGRQAAAAGVTAMSRDSVGFFGYGAGPSVQIVDRLGLCDPLLARLPAEASWRIGHFSRPIPAGYMEMLRGRQDHLADPALNEYYAALSEITRGPLWSRARWAAILTLNTSRIRAPTPGLDP